MGILFIILVIMFTHMHLSYATRILKYIILVKYNPCIVFLYFKIL